MQRPGDAVDRAQGSDAVDGGDGVGSRRARRRENDRERVPIMLSVFFLFPPSLSLSLCCLPAVGERN